MVLILTPDAASVRGCEPTERGANTVGVSVLRLAQTAAELPMSAWDRQTYGDRRTYDSSKAAKKFEIGGRYGDSITRSNGGDICTWTLFLR